MGTLFPVDGRRYSTADALGAWFHTRTPGVFSSEQDFSVTANGSMTITVSSGIAWVKVKERWGAQINIPESTTITLTPPVLLSVEYQAVTIRGNKVTGDADCYIKKNNDGSKPLPDNDDTYVELIVAYIPVSKTTTSITASMINDVRLDDSVCGLAGDGIRSIPTQTLYKQAEDTISQAQKLLTDAQADEAHMLSAVYDPQGFEKDIFEYADKAIDLLKNTGIESFSAQEKRIGTYFGKPLYAKTITNYSLSAGAGTTVPTHSVNLGLLGADRIVRLEGICQTADRSVWLAFPSPHNLAKYAINAWGQGSNLLIEVGTDRKNLKADITIQYTKATD